MMAKALATNGAKKVYILGRRVEPLEAAAAAHEGVLVPIQCDVTSKDSLETAVRTITKDEGYVNLLCANSGVLGPTNGYNPELSVSQLRQRMFAEVDMQEFSNTFHVNVTGAFFTMLAFLELLDAGNKKALKGGFGAPLEGSSVPVVQSQVIFTASIAAYMRHRVTAPAYAGSKAAVVQLTKQAAHLLSPYGIRANALAPGCTLTLPRWSLPLLLENG